METALDLATALGMVLGALGLLILTVGGVAVASMDHADLGVVAAPPTGGGGGGTARSIQARRPMAAPTAIGPRTAPSAVALTAAVAPAA